MTYVRALRGIRSGKEYVPGTLLTDYSVDVPVEMVLDLERLRVEKPNGAWYYPERNGMWRFGSLLPLDTDNPADAGHIVSLGEGHTPVLPYADHPLARKKGFRLEVKDESVNPTRSFKDRGMSVVVSMARMLGLRKLALPTQGNAGDALVEYGMSAGLEVAVVMPDDTPAPVKQRVAAHASASDRVHLDLVHGTIREAACLLQEKYLSDGYFNVATFQDPGWRIEGKKTMGLELAEPAEPGSPWRLPDVIIYPTGGGTGMVGMWKAFAELEALGLIDDRRPRMVCAQSEHTAPIVRAFNRGAGDAQPVEAGRTVAVGLNVPGGIGHFRVLQILYESSGHALTVSDEAILQTLHNVYSTKGWAVSPEGAAALAALKELVDRDVIREGDHVVAFNTASLDKYRPDLSDLDHLPPGGRSPN